MLDTWICKMKLLGVYIDYFCISEGCYVFKSVNGKIKEFIIPEGVSIIQSHCFKDFDCETLIFPKSCNDFGVSCCTSIPNLRTLICLGENVNFDCNAFLNCTQLKSVHVTGIGYLGKSCFRDCYNLESFIIDNKTSYLLIDKDCFAWDTALREFSFDKIGSDSVISSGVFSDNAFTSINLEKATNLVLRCYSFYKNKYLKVLILPKSVLFLEDRFLDESNTKIVRR